MVEALLAMGGNKLLIPLAVVLALPVVMRAFFSLHRSRSQDRRDFLDLWRKVDTVENLWLEVAVRHQFGEYLPASVIRKLMTSAQSARSLRDVAAAWHMIDMDDETGELRWRVKTTRRNEKRDRITYLVSYFFFMFSAIAIPYIYYLGSQEVAWTVWMFSGEVAAFALWGLYREGQIASAGRARRWLRIS